LAYGVDADLIAAAAAGMFGVQAALLQVPEAAGPEVGS
jgi:hypothetical protein